MLSNKSTSRMSRWQAAGIHLLISVLAAIVVGSLIYFVWFPQPYFEVAGGNTLMLVIMGVDVVIGPFLTLVVFKTGKKSLRFDLSVIAILQLAAFVYGIVAITGARPVYVVAEVDRFILVGANQLEDADLADAKPEYASRSWTGPRLVGAIAPPKGDDVFKMVNSALAGKDIDKFPKYYVSYADVADDLEKRARPFAGLLKKPKQEADLAQAFLDSSGGNADDFVYVPIQGRLGDFAMILSKKTKLPVTTLAIDPW